MRIHSCVESLLNDGVRIRQDLHRIPEIGFELYKTSEYVIKELKKYSPDSLEVFAQTGVKAVFLANNATETIGIRADMDALNTLELSDIPYKSIHEGRMHACGHDGHTTMLLLVAQLIYNNKDRLKVNVVLLFQPAEEGKGGARVMINEGALKNPDVNRVYGMHLWPDVPKGKIGIRWGPMMAKTCELDITVRGVSAHGASPQTGVDAVVASAAFITLIQTALTRNVDPHHDALLTIGKINGGVAHNIIADKVVMNATLRVFSNNVYEQLMCRIQSMADGIAVATSAKISITEKMHYPSVDNPRKMVEEFYTYVDMEDIVLIEPVMAAEDFSCYQEEVPGIYMFLGIQGGKNTAPLHNNLFDFDEDAMLYGVEVYRRLIGI